ncbi:MAG: hypothetical protein AAB405_00990 [Patescibacteria group bacterium]
MLKPLKIKEDERGLFTEIFNMGEAGEVLYATINSGKSRGNHYHKEKEEFFCVLEGSAKFKMRNVKTGEKKECELFGDNLQILEILPWWTHSVENIGDTTIKFLEYGNRPYNAVSPDSFSEIV